MFATQYFRSAFKLLILAALLVAAPACRTGSTPEAGVDARLFEQPGASLGYNSRGYWFAVAAKSSSITDYVTIDHAGQTELFYAVARGDRAAQLLPLTPVASAWFATAVENGARPAFHSTLDEVRTSDPVGLWSGEPARAIEWLGEAPSQDHTAVALPAAAPTSPSPFHRWARGVVTVRENTAVQASKAGPAGGELGDGPFLLLPERATTGQSLRVVNISTRDVATPEHPQIAVETRPGPSFSANSLYDYALLPVGRQHAADLLFFDAEDAQFVFHVGPEHARLGDEARLVAAVAQTPLMLRDSKAASSAMRGFHALRQGRPLAAAFWLRPDELRVGHNEQASALRLAELPAAAGLTQWSRLALLEDADGMSADRVLYLARAHALEGDLAQAIAYASRAAASFQSWPEPASYTGAARAKSLRAHLEYLQGENEKAVDFARDAVDGFKTASDALRQADAEMQLAGYLFALGSPDHAIKYANLARSRYYHGGSPYFSALAEIELAELFLENGQSEKALEMAGYARARMKKFEEPVGFARATLVEVLAQHAAGQKRDISGELKNALSRAREHKDLRTQALAASHLVTRAGVDDAERMLTLGSVLLSTRHDVTDPLVERAVQRALASLCGQGFARLAANADAPADGARQLDADRACAVALENSAGDPETLAAWLDQGYEALQHDNMTLARSTAQQLAESLDESLEKASPVLAAEIYLFQHAMQTVPAESARPQQEFSDSDTTSLDRALSLLDQGIDPASAATTLHKLAREHRARGLTVIAGHLAKRAMKTARDQKQYEQERDALFFLLDTYQSADMPSEVLEIARDGRKVVSRAGPGSEPLEARVLVYQSDAEYRLGRTSDGGLHRSNALATAKNAEDAVHLELLLLAARLDMDRRAIEAAEPLIIVGLGMYNALGPKTRTEARFAAHLTHLHTLHGELGLRLGKLEAAQKAFDTALRLSTDASSPQVLQMRARALVARAGMAGRTGSDDPETAATFQDKLVSLLDQLGDFASPQHTLEAHRTGVEYFTDAGDASTALALAKRVHDAGYSLAPRRAAPCVIARPRLFAGKQALAIRNLKTCAASNRGEVHGEFATLLLALTDKALDASQRAKTAATIQDTLADELTASERDRLAFIQSLARPKADFDERRAARLEESAKTDPSAADVEAYVSYLMSVGRLAEASAFTDKHSSVFFEQGQESPGALIRLRLEAMVRQLQPVEASLFAQRALSESGDLTAQERARIDFLLAKNEVVLGRWWRAAQLWADARDAATDRSLVRDIDAFAKRFPQLGNRK